MLFNSETSNDVSKYFRGCYVKFPQTGDYLCMVDSVDSERIIGKIFTPDSEGNWDERPYQHPLFEGVEIDFVLPKKSYFNYDGSAHFLYRIPARQYRKGICPENTAVIRMSSNGGLHGINFNFHMLTAYVNKQQFLPFGTTGKNSYAVAPRMAVSKQGHIFVDKTIVGFYDGKSIIVRHKLFQEDVEKVLKAHNQVIPISVGPLPKTKQEEEKEAAAKKMMSETKGASSVKDSVFQLFAESL